VAQFRSDNAVTAEIGPEDLARYDPDGLMFVNVNTPHDDEGAKGLLDLTKANRITNVRDERAPIARPRTPIT
jgi:hypothetical protein